MEPNDRDDTTPFGWTFDEIVAAGPDPLGLFADDGDEPQPEPDDATNAN